ncbi:MULTISPECIES: AIPR family protein [Paenibacillus]|uniref:Abortive infection phage resistance protein n=1 Tax=Paenibacillus albilobatus TaxID=2716884 RepID=A0A920CBQ5_9BACL|nr:MULTISPECIES: AIPR family protein [Paenibacillus]GIO33670.1 putative abortive infection phage resistance protein [Paenibacillus albilobatus]
MSIIHVTQIKNYLLRAYKGLIDLSDCNPNENENFFLTRALTAYAIQNLAQVDPATASKYVVDGSNDNGIDGIYFDDKMKVLYIVQSKWIGNGTGEPENGDIKKFIAGTKDLVNFEFNIFNNKVKALSDIVMNAINDFNIKIQIVLAYTGINLSEMSKRDFANFENDMNDANDILSTTILNQTRLHDSLKTGVSGEPIHLEIGIKEWGKKDAPLKAYYGQVNGNEIADWWNKYDNRLFTKNLRELIGDTEINRDIRLTIEKDPDNFWYFNNGITIICKSISKSALGGGDNSFGQFKCEDVSIVNGAQTVGTIGKYSVLKDNKEKLEKIFVHVRIISLENTDEEFGKNITKNNNRQNKIENRDFVALDPEQSRIQTELAIEKINYYIMRTETQNKKENSFDLVDSTTALACAFNRPSIAVQLKREIGKLWENIEKYPYTALFNPGVSGIYVWRCVKIQRGIDEAIHKLSLNKLNRDYSMAIHGNRIIAHLIFQELPLSEIGNPNYNFDIFLQNFNFDVRVTLNYDLLNQCVNDLFGNTAVVPTLFKNVKKCESLVEEIIKIKKYSDL